MATSIKTSTVILAASGLTLFLYVMPFMSPLAYPFLLLSTLCHEMAHGFAAMLVGGHFHSFKMWADGSGVAQISGEFGAFSKAFVAAMGLVGPSMVAAIFFVGTKTVKTSRVILGLFGIVCLLALLLVVRNIFGMGFVAVLTGLCWYFALGRGQSYAQAVLAFLAAQLALSVFSRSDYLFTESAITEQGIMPSDVEKIAQALWLPYWFWGALCGVFSVLVLAWGLKRSLQ
jgi:hypothetical protein